MEELFLFSIRSIFDLSFHLDCWKNSIASEKGVVGRRRSTVDNNFSTGLVEGHRSDAITVELAVPCRTRELLPPELLPPEPTLVCVSSTSTKGSSTINDSISVLRQKRVQIHEST